MKTTLSDVSLCVEPAGKVSLAERGPKNEQGYFTSIHYVEDRETGFCLTLDLEEDGGAGIGLRLIAHHIPDASKERHFHMIMDVILSRADATLLHRFLGFLLETQR